MNQESGNGNNLIKLMFQAHNAVGIDQRIDGAIAEIKGDIEDQQADKNEECGLFFSRKVFRVPRYNDQVHTDIESVFRNLASQYAQSKFSLKFPDDPPERIVVMVSKPLHLVWDLLGQWKYGAFRSKIEIAHIISNHDDAKVLAHRYGVDFDNVARDGNYKDVDWQAVRQIIEANHPDWIDSARWMQPVPGEIIQENSPYSRPILNLHHGAAGFEGQAPYKRVMLRGAKNTAAMGHFMVEKIDAGHIITEISREIPSYVRDARDLEIFGSSIEQLAHTQMVQLKLDHRLWPYEFRVPKQKPTDEPVRLCARFY